MIDFFLSIALFLLGIGIGLGFAMGESGAQEKCVAYYADMPHNKVEQHCTELLKFEKK